MWEWCADWFDEEEYQRRAKPVVKDPQGPKEGPFRVLRGGAFFNLRRNVRCASRSADDPDFRYWYRGFGWWCPPSPLDSENFGLWSSGEGVWGRAKPSPRRVAAVFTRWCYHEFIA
jgi:hypothetical protein